MRINFLEETIDFLNENNKQESDVLWIGRNYYDYANEEQITYKTTWDDFSKKANFYYNNGYGGVVIPMDLIVVEKDFWLERHEYDGSEWWTFKSFPKEPVVLRELEKMCAEYRSDI